MLREAHASVVLPEILPPSSAVATVYRCASAQVFDWEVPLLVAPLAMFEIQLLLLESRLAVSRVACTQPSREAFGSCLPN